MEPATTAGLAEVYHPLRPREERAPGPPYLAVARGGGAVPGQHCIFHLARGSRRDEVRLRKTREGLMIFDGRVKRARLAAGRVCGVSGREWKMAEKRLWPAKNERLVSRR